MAGTHSPDSDIMTSCAVRWELVDTALLFEQNTCKHEMVVYGAIRPIFLAVIRWEAKRGLSMEECGLHWACAPVGY